MDVCFLFNVHYEEGASWRSMCTLDVLTNSIKAVVPEQTFKATMVSVWTVSMVLLQSIHNSHIYRPAN